MTAVKRNDRNGEWWADFRWKGRRIRSKAPLQSKRGAEQLERQLRRQFSEDEDHGMNPFAGPPPKFAEFVERWMTDYVVPNNRRSTAREKSSALTSRLLPAFGSLRLDAITSVAVDRAIANWREIGLSSKRIKNLLTVLRRCLKCGFRPIPITRFARPDHGFRHRDHAFR